MNLSNCQYLRTIKANVFSPLAELRSLDLSFCSNIESIDPAAFDDLASIEKLNLSSTDLVSFETKCTPKKLKCREVKV
jgi:hypothetical protein